MRHLNDRFGDYELGHDEDFEGPRGDPDDRPSPGRAAGGRAAAVRAWSGRSSTPRSGTSTRPGWSSPPSPTTPRSRMTTCIQAFYDQLSAAVPPELPARYDRLATPQGLARFISDMMHHLIIRHEIYGTSGRPPVLDPRINKVQVPKDGGPYAIDEWRRWRVSRWRRRGSATRSLMTDFSDIFDDLQGPRGCGRRTRGRSTACSTRLKDLDDAVSPDGIDELRDPPAPAHRPGHRGGVLSPARGANGTFVSCGAVVLEQSGAALRATRVWGSFFRNFLRFL